MASKIDTYRNLNLFGTFLGSKAGEAPEKSGSIASDVSSDQSKGFDPADQVLNYLKEHNGDTPLQDMLEDLGGNVSLYLQTIEQLKDFGLIKVVKDDAGKSSICFV